MYVSDLIASSIVCFFSRNVTLKMGHCDAIDMLDRSSNDYDVPDCSIIFLLIYGID